MTDMLPGWAAIIVGVLTLAGVIITLVSKWLAGMSKRLRRLEERDRRSWLYIRSLIDHAYRHGALPLPEPPKGWLDDDD